MMMMPHILGNSFYFGSKFRQATASSHASHPSANPLEKTEANLISLLKKNLPKDTDASFLTSENLKELKFKKTDSYAAVIRHQAGTEEGASTRSWELKKMDPATLTQIEAGFTDYAKAKESESKKTGTRANAASEASIRARIQKKQPVIACIYGGQGNTHRIHQDVVREAFKTAYRDKFEIRPIDFPVTGIKRDAALQEEYDATNRDPELNEAKWQEQMKTPQKQDMAQKMEEFLAEVDPDVVFSNYDTIARIAMDQLKKKYGEDRPPMIQHLSDLGEMHSRWILKEFTEKNSKDLVLTAGQAIIPGESDQRKFVLDQGVPLERVIHTGAPVRSDFNEVRQMSKQDCRNELRKEHEIDIPDGKMSFLTMSGSGFWPEKFVAANEALVKSGLSKKIHIVALAGVLKKTKQELQKTISSSIDILGYTDGRKLALLQRAVDVNIIKGGGGGIPEVVNTNRAFLLNDALPGPEPENAEFVREQGIGLVALITQNEDGTAYNTDEFMKAVRNIIEHPEILEQIEEAQKAHIIEDSAERIADILHRTGMEHFEAKREREALAQTEPSQEIPELD